MRLAPPARDPSAAPQLVYAVRSRRAGGVSLGVDLTPNGACGFRCVYCDVEGLVDRDGPELDVAALGAELDEAFAAVADPGWAERAGIPSGDAGPKSLCISGRGEPTRQFSFREALEVIASRAAGRVPRLALLTNGADLSNKRVREGLAHLAGAEGEIWFKLDSATREGQRATNGSDLILRHVRNALRVACETCPTWIQTALFTRGGSPMSDAERAAYLAFLGDQKRSGLPLAGVQLYGTNRPSARPEAAELGDVDPAFAAALADDVRALGIDCELF